KGKGENNIYVSCIDGSGNFIWANQIAYSTGGHTPNPLPSMSSPRITINNSGDCYLNAGYTGSPKFAGINFFSGSFNSFISKLDDNGQFVWAKGFGGGVADMAVDETGNCYLTGAFSGQSYFGIYLTPYG